MPTLNAEAIAIIRKQHPDETRASVIQMMLQSRLEHIRQTTGSGIMVCIKEFIRADGDLTLAIANCRNMDMWHHCTTPPRISEDGRTVLPCTL